MGSLTNSGVLLRLPCANGDVARPPSPRLPRGHQEHEYRNSSLLPPLLGVQNPNEIAVCVLKAALMLYPSRAFVTRPLVVWHPGALASFPTPPSHPTSVWGARAPPQARASGRLQKAQSISGFVHITRTTVAADPCHSEDQMALGRLEPNPAPSMEPRAQ